MVFLAGDFFTLYVALELVAFAAVPLVSLDGRAETLQAALRYLLFALAGSVLYLVGTVLIYGGYGTLDIALLAEQARADPVAIVAARADDSRPAGQDRTVPAAPVAAASARRRAGGGERAAFGPGDQGLVLPGDPAVARCLWQRRCTPPRRSSLATFGAGAIVIGSVVALQQARLKLMIAYSTVGADRLPVPDVSAGAGRRVGQPPRPRRWPAAYCR